MSELLTKLPNQYGTPVAMVMSGADPLIVTADGYLLKVFARGVGRPPSLHVIKFELGEKQLP